MSSRKILEADDLRAELARHRISKRELSSGLSISYDYVLKILDGRRDAEKRREEMADYVAKRAGEGK